MIGRLIRYWSIICVAGCSAQPVSAPTPTPSVAPVLIDDPLPAAPREEGVYSPRGDYSRAVLGVLRGSVLSDKLEVTYNEAGPLSQSIECAGAVPRRRGNRTSITAQCAYRHRHMKPEELVLPKPVELYIDIVQLDDSRVSLQIHKVFMPHGMPLVDAIAIQAEMGRTVK